MRQTGLRLAGTVAAVLVMWTVWHSSVTLRAATGHYVVSGVTVVDLGTLGGRSSTAYDINNAGEIVGGADRADGRSHAFKIMKGVMVDLDPFGSRSLASTISPGGVAGGYVEMPWAPGREQPAIFAAGGISLALHLDRSPAPCQWSAQVTGLNDAGQMSGSAWLEGDSRCDYVHSAVYWNSRSERPIEHVGYGYDAWGYGINSSGIAVGSRVDYPLYDAFTFMGPLSRELATLDTGYWPDGCEYNYPYAINDAGNVVGAIGCPPGSGGPYLGYSAVIWYAPDASGSRPNVIPRPSGAANAAAYDINAQRFVVGTARGSYDYSPRSGFLWGENLGTVLLPTLAPSAHCDARALADFVVTTGRNGRLTAVGTCTFGGPPSYTRAVKWTINLRWVPLA